MLLNSARTIAKLFGLDIVRFERDFRTDHNKKDFLERLLCSRLKSSNPTIFDVGAHVGESVIWFKDMFPDCEVHAFEPDPNSFIKLRDRCSKWDNVIVNNCAVGEKSGKTTLNQTIYSPTNSILAPNLDYEKVQGIMKKYDKNEYVTDQISVDMISLDDYLLTNSLAHIDLLKIDTQGYESECLKGAIHLIKEKRISLILTEIIFSQMYSKSSSFYEIEQWLVDYGFRLININQASIEKRTGHLNQLDALYAYH